MSQAIFKQFVRSPRSYVKYRILEMGLLRRNSFKNKFRLAAHYISSCIFAKDKNWLRNSPSKCISLMALPIGLLLNLYIRYKSRD